MPSKNNQITHWSYPMLAKEGWTVCAMKIPYDLSKLIMISEWCIDTYFNEDIHIMTSLFWFRHERDATLFLLKWYDEVLVLGRDGNSTSANYLL